MTALAFLDKDLRALDSQSGEALMLPVFEGERPPGGLVGAIDFRLCGQISKRIADGHFSGALGEIFMFPPGTKLPFAKIYLFGAGLPSQFDLEQARAALRAALKVVENGKLHQAFLALPRCHNTASLDVHAFSEIVMEELSRHAAISDIVLLEDPDVMSVYLEAHNRHQLIESAALLDRA